MAVSSGSITADCIVKEYPFSAELGAVVRVVKLAEDGVISDVEADSESLVDDEIIVVVCAEVECKRLVLGTGEEVSDCVDEVGPVPRISEE